MRPMLDAVHFEPFVFGRRAEEALEIAARMQRLPAPVCGREERRLYLRPDWRAATVVIVFQWMGADVVAERHAVAGELLLRQRLRSADELTMHAAALAALARAVLHGLHLHVVPV